MTPDEYLRLQELFLELREMPKDKRAEVLNRTEHQSLKDEVLSLLEVEEESARFLDIEESKPDETKPIDATDPGNDAPKRLGPYRLLQVIGEGGFGTVYLAEQTEPVTRKVAVKLLKPGMDSAQVLARFHAERQALAMMNHPSIASVFDAGTSDAGRPYFVMELVKGIQIHDFCDQNNLDLGERLNLFAQVCDAVHHAHQKGIIHRDLKPANILVTMGEQEPLAKVIDFGIAKALDARLTDDTLFTAFGQMIGTLEYMSPEQAEMSAVDIDTRSDVYSLGAVLYQLLTGEPPIARKNILESGYLEIARRIREIEPLTPSTRVTSTQTSISRVDRSDPLRGLTNLRSGDLDWIVLKALAKDRRKRYETALDLARDIERSQQGLPVDAHPPSLGYRFGKFVWRHRIAVAAASVLLIGMIVGIAGLGIGLRNSSIARQQAEDSRESIREAQQETIAKARQLEETIYPELLNAAWRAANQLRFGHAKHLLSTADGRLRSWEWDFAHALLNDPEYEVLRSRGESAVVVGHVDSTGRRIACVTASGELEIRSTDDEELLRRFPVDSLATTVQFSKDGDRVFVGTVEGHLIVIDTETWTVLHKRQMMSGGVYDIAFDQSGNRLSISTGGAWIKLLDADSLGIIQEWKLPTRVADLVFGIDQSSLLGAGVNGRLYQIHLDESDFQEVNVSSASLRKIELRGDDEVVVLDDRRILIMGLSDSSPSQSRIVEASSALSTFGVASDGSLLVGGGDGRLLRKLPDGSADAIANFGSAVRMIQSVGRSGNLIVALADGRLLRMREDSRVVWGSVVQSELTFTSGVLVDIHRLALLLSDDGMLCAFDVATGALVQRKKAHSVGWSVAADDRGRRVVTVGEDRVLRCWSLPELDVIFEKDIGWGVRDVCIAPDGRWIASGPPENSKAPSGSIGIWNADSGECEQVLRGHENWVISLKATHDSTRLVSGGVNRTSRLWDVSNGTSIHVLKPLQGSVADQFAFDPEDDELYIGYRDGRVTKWDLESGQLQATWIAFGDSLSGLATTQDGRVLAASQSDRNLRVHDFDLGKTVATFDMNMGYIKGLELSSDTSCIGILGEDGSVRLGALD